MGKYRVWLLYSSYEEKTIINGEVLAWPEIQRLLGEKLLECQSARMHAEGNGYSLYGQYQSAGGSILPFWYELTFEVFQE